jgi:hypothetical protein
MERRPEPPIQPEGVPEEEGISTADAAEQAEQDPEEKENLSGEARREQQESREKLARQIDEDTPLADRAHPEDR